MPSRNEQLLLDSLADFNERGPDAFMELITDDFEFTTPPALAAEPDTYVGAEGMRRYWDSFYEVMEKIELIADRYDEIGGHVVAELIVRATGRTTGITADQHVFTVWILDGGKASGLKIFATWDEAASAAQR